MQIVRSIDDHFPRLSADYRAVKQMLLNLLSNAVKFTPRGGSVLLSTAIAADGGLQLSVADTGIGIAAADLERIFTPFEQVDDSLSRQHSGTGLGLALVKTLIELHHGSVSINSKLGAGTTVTLHFPSGAIIADLGQTRNGNPKRQAGNY